MRSRPGSALLPLQHRRHLARNLARRQVANDPQPRRQAELAIHRAANLARHADRRPRPFLLRSISWRSIIWRRVALFAAIPLRHPHRLDRLPVVAGDQVPLRPIHRAEGLDNRRQSHPQPRRGHALPQLFWPGRDFLQASHFLPVKGRFSCRTRYLGNPNALRASLSSSFQRPKRAPSGATPGASKVGVSSFPPVVIYLSENSASKIDHRAGPYSPRRKLP